MELKLTDDQINKIVIDDLIGMMETYMDDGDDTMVNCIVHILKIYMKESDYQQFLKNYNLEEFYDDEIVIDDIIDSGDDSIVKFTVPDKMKEALIAEGFKFLLMKSAIGNPSDDEIYKKLGIGK